MRDVTLHSAPPPLRVYPDNRHTHTAADDADKGLALLALPLSGLAAAILIEQHIPQAPVYLGKNMPHIHLCAKWRNKSLTLYGRS